MFVITFEESKRKKEEVNRAVIPIDNTRDSHTNS